MWGVRCTTAAAAAAHPRAEPAGLFEGNCCTRTGANRALGAAKVRLLWCSLITLWVFAVAFPAAAAPPQVWTAPSLVRVGPDDAAGTGASIQLYAARGETESFQIIVKAPTGGLTNVNVVAPDLAGPQPTLYREYYAYLPNGSPDYATNHNHPLGAGWYPDGLIPFNNPDTGQDLSGALDAVPFSLAAGKNQPIWADVYVPRTTPAGSYPGTFQVTSDQGDATATLNLTVWDFALPLQPAMKSLFRYSQSSYVRDSQPARELVRHRLMPAFVSTSEERALIDALGLNTTGVPFYSNTDISTGHIDPAPSVSEFQTEAAKHQSDLPLYDYMADEIGSYSPFYPTIKEWARNMHAAGIDNLITMMPDPGLYDDGSGTGRSAVDIWVVLPKQYDQVPDRVSYVIGKGDEVWSYNCLQQDGYSPKWLLDLAPINYRIQPGFINQSLNLTGLLYWAVDFWGSDPWNNPMPWPPYPAEGLLVYPGEQAGLPGYTLGSIRLKWLRDGVDDYDYIQLLKEQGLGDWALSIARTIGPDWTNWSRDPGALEAARVQLGEELSRLGGGPPTHTITVSAAADPSAVASGGTVNLTGVAADSQGHAIASWLWSDNGAGGSFSSATAQSPFYTAPTNTGATDEVVTLSVTATCGDSSPVNGGASTAITVQPAPSPLHTVTVTASADPSTVVSGGSVALGAVATDSQSYPAFAWSWSDGGAGGTFSATTSQSPVYTAPTNAGTTDETVTLTVTATCDDASPASGSASVALTVQPAPAEVRVTVVSTAVAVALGGETTLQATAQDSLGHAVASWSWSDGGAGGTFSPSATVQNPTYRAPSEGGDKPLSIILRATATCAGSPPATGTGQTILTVLPADPGVMTDVPPDYWAYPYIKACVEAGIITGYGDGTYRPQLPVTREQMATYLARGIAGSDANVPPGPDQPSFSDMLPDQWAYRYIEYVASLGVVTGFPDGTYRPAQSVDRGQLAVFIARAVASPPGEGGLQDYVPPAFGTFRDVRHSFWAYTYIENIAAQGIVQGYDNNTYRPWEVVTRDQMAVYLTRAFDLPL